MKLWKPFAKSKHIIAPVEKKSSSLWPSQWLLAGASGVNTYVNIKRALQFYDEAAPVATAIDWINDEFKTLKVRLQTDNKIDYQSDILSFLNRPNDDMTQEDFLESLGAYYLVCNEVYIVATGAVNRKPAEMLVISPEYVEVFQGKDGFIETIKVQLVGREVEIYKRTETGFRFYNAAKDREIWQIKGFSAVNNSALLSSSYNASSLTPVRGRSKLNSIHREINQYVEVAEHNLTMLDNGLLPSGTITMKEDAGILTEEQFENIREQVVNYYSGAKNAGKVMILDNGLTFTPMGINPKDMDFEKLSKSVTTTIFNRYKVPLPLISAENMTLANMDTAKLNLYDNCVIPLSARLFRELTNFLAPRYNLKPNQLLYADLQCVPALQTRHFEQLKLKRELNLYSVNYFREALGDEKSTQPGTDDIYAPWTFIPLGAQTTRLVQPDNNQKPTEKQFIAIMEKQIDVKGNRIFSDNEIKEMMIKEGL